MEVLLADHQGRQRSEVFGYLERFDLLVGMANSEGSCGIFSAAAAFSSEELRQSATRGNVLHFQKHLLLERGSAEDAVRECQHVENTFFALQYFFLLI